MSRQDQVRRTCQYCGKKRANCTRDNPGEICTDTGQDCVSDSSYHESQDDLRAEVKRLKQRKEQNDALLAALSSKEDSDTYNMVVQGLLDETKTRQTIFRQLIDKRNAGASGRGAHIVPKK
ncbi:hypothetical protein Purlil1_13386 [Purpureocillium lilacinum]|uniref:Zn(2)-C6 fungal-type domain-containing protein n=1 Tax=Purpureocillium lilacinum TaxID=33203 RepID=A0ABR0BEF4_PURLI|nr:hypothetical protein Purlil1_13386 [Purpureocillium lilacinum]